MPYWDDLKHNELDEIDGPDDVRLPSTMHHMQVKAELDLLVRAEALTDDEAKQAMQTWRASQEMTNDRKLRAAVTELESRGLLDDEAAESIREDMAG